MSASLFTSVIVSQALKLGLESKTKQHTDLNLGSAQIVEELRFMRWHKGATSLELQEQTFLNEHISGKVANLLAPKPDRHLNLS
jgi:hypothetical protein